MPDDTPRKWVTLKEARAMLDEAGIAVTIRKLWNACQAEALTKHQPIGPMIYVPGREIREVIDGTRRL